MIVTRHTALSDPATQGGHGNGRARLLLVEPDAPITHLVGTILTDAGYAVDHATTPDAAGAHLVGDMPATYDVVLSVPYADPLHAPYAWLDRPR